MLKKGQITLFIIMGIIILITISLVLILKINSSENTIPKITNIFSSKESLENQIEGCIKDSLKTTIKINSQQGGYYFLPLESTFYETGDIFASAPFYMVNKEKTIISKSELAEEISYGIISETEECINKIENLKYDEENIEVEIKFVGNKILVDVNLKSWIEKENTQIELGTNYQSEVESEYIKLYNIAIEITQLEEELVCLSCIHNIAEKYNIEISMIDYIEENNYIIIYNIFGEELIYSFAHQEEIK